MDLTSQDYAFIKTPSGKLLLGLGPFEELEQCPRQGVAFYVNSFDLSETKPWRVPAEVHEIREKLGSDAGTLTVSWSAPKPEGFATVFSEINEMIQRGLLEKSVPVTTERGKIESGEVRSLLQKIKFSDTHFYPYAWNCGEKGFCGQTPELLFHLRKGRLKTMALAGTARAEEASIFAFDEKEIREHEYVAQTLVASLSDIGMVKRGDRSVMDLGSLVHFHTPIEVFMYGDHNVDFLIRKLHPTPALGPLPRTQETLELLYEWRKRLQAPAAFGAPFGVYDNGEFHAVVAIRGVHWNDQEIVIPSGCGVIEASRLTNEWRELELKRNAVKTKFGL